MTESAAQLVDTVLPRQPMRQWDGVFVDDEGDKSGQRFKPVTQYQASEIVELAHKIANTACQARGC